MEATNERVKALRHQIVATENELKKLKGRLASIEADNKAQDYSAEPLISDERSPVTASKWPLSLEEYKRYGRQMVVPSIGIQGQLRLKESKVLLVGAGGLGCPAAAYISGAGVGTVGIVDGDDIEISNLHRQILHTTQNVGMKKVDSIIQYLKSLNPNLKYNAHTEHLTPENAENIVSQYDLVLDCTDHPTSRYLISDICILLRKPLVSASALRTDGQLIVLNSPPLPPGDTAGGPCYRCVFPKPPPAESVVSCGDGGILGPVVGVMGVLQALEAIKLVVDGKLTFEGHIKGENSAASMLLFSANSIAPFRTVKLRARRPGCFACSSDGSLNFESLKNGSLDYNLFCGVTSPVSVLRPEERMEARDYEMIRPAKKHLLLDVREKVQFDICNLEESINVPFSTLQGSRAVSAEEQTPYWISSSFPADAPIYVVCKLGNDSQVVTRKLKESGLAANGRHIMDIRGGFKAWKDQVDTSWPDF